MSTSARCDVRGAWAKCSFHWRGTRSSVLPAGCRSMRCRTSTRSDLGQNKAADEAIENSCVAGSLFGDRERPVLPTDGVWSEFALQVSGAPDFAGAPPRTLSVAPLGSGHTSCLQKESGKTVERGCAL